MIMHFRQLKPKKHIHISDKVNRKQNQGLAIATQNMHWRDLDLFSMIVVLLYLLRNVCRHVMYNNYISGLPRMSSFL